LLSTVDLGVLVSTGRALEVSDLLVSTVGFVGSATARIEVSAEGCKIEG